MIVFNAPRIVMYLALIALAVAGETPWWVPVMFLLYDTRYLVSFVLPWKRKEIAAQIEAERQAYIDMVMGRSIEAPKGKDN
jgi:hypothetical protein